MPIDKEALRGAVSALQDVLDAGGHENWGWSLNREWGDGGQHTLHLNGGSVGWTETVATLEADRHLG